MYEDKLKTKANVSYFILAYNENGMLNEDNSELPGWMRNNTKEKFAIKSLVDLSQEELDKRLRSAQKNFTFSIENEYKKGDLNFFKIKQTF